MNICMLRQKPDILVPALKARKWNEISNGEIADRIYYSAVEEGLYLPYVTSDNDTLKMEWREGERYLIINITNSKVTYRYGNDWDSKERTGELLDIDKQFRKFANYLLARRTK